MVVKPIALVAVAALVIVGAGTGAYLAVRDNRVPVADGSDTLIDIDQSEPTSTAAPAIVGAVEATEEVIGEDDDDDDAPPPSQPAEAPPVAPNRSSTTENEPGRVAANSGGTSPVSSPGSETPPSATDRDQRSGTTPSGASRLPEVDGWEPLSEPWPRRDRDDEEALGPDQVSLRSVGREALGSVLRPEEPPVVFDELVIAADSVIGLQVDTPVSTDTAEVEDDVEARVTRDVLVDDQVAIPAGTRVLGSVVLVERAGQLKGASRLGVRFHTVVLDDIVELPMVTETVYREGRGRGGESAAKIGGAAVGGAILGAIFGGGRGAAIGGAAGAAGGTAAAMAGDGQAATLPAGSTLTVRLSSPVAVTVER